MHCLKKLKGYRNAKVIPLESHTHSLNTRLMGANFNSEAWKDEAIEYQRKLCSLHPSKTEVRSFLFRFILIQCVCVQKQVRLIYKFACISAKQMNKWLSIVLSIIQFHVGFMFGLFSLIKHTHTQIRTGNKQCVWRVETEFVIQRLR